MDSEAEDGPFYTDSLPVILSEARRRYDAESERNSFVESKIATVVTIDALIVSIVGTIFGVLGSRDPLVAVFVVVVVAPAAYSTWIGLRTLRTREYRSPGKSIGDFDEYTDLEPVSLRKDLVRDYAVSVEGNRKIADDKYGSLRSCMRLTFVSLVLTGFGSVGLVGVRLLVPA